MILTLFSIVLLLSLLSSSVSVLLVSSQPVAQYTCDSSLWNYVYDPSRLKVVEQCILVSGTIKAISAEADGDYHILLALDPQYQNLTNSANTIFQQGDLVVETVCQNPVSQQNAIAACSNYGGTHFTIPPVGTNVRVTGPYVLDLHHFGWAEIHPVNSIQPTANTPDFPIGISMGLLAAMLAGTLMIFRMRINN